MWITAKSRYKLQAHIRAPEKKRSIISRLLKVQLWLHSYGALTHCQEPSSPFSGFSPLKLESESYFSFKLIISDPFHSLQSEHTLFITLVYNMLSKSSNDCTNRNPTAWKSDTLNSSTVQAELNFNSEQMLRGTWSCPCVTVYMEDQATIYPLNYSTVKNTKWKEKKKTDVVTTADRQKKV